MKNKNNSMGAFPHAPVKTAGRRRPGSTLSAHETAKCRNLCSYNNLQYLKKLIFEKYYQCTCVFGSYISKRIEC